MKGKSLNNVPLFGSSAHTTKRTPSSKPTSTPAKTTELTKSRSFDVLDEFSDVQKPIFPKTTSSSRGAQCVQAVANKKIVTAKPANLHRFIPSVAKRSSSSITSLVDPLFEKPSSSSYPAQHLPMRPSPPPSEKPSPTNSQESAAQATSSSSIFRTRASPRSHLTSKAKKDHSTDAQGSASNPTLIVSDDEENKENDGADLFEIEANAASEFFKPPKRLSRAKSSEEIVLSYPPNMSKGAVNLTVSDVRRLREGEFLNDSLVDFYLKYLELNVVTPSQSHRFHFFTTFFYKRLATGSSTVGEPGSGSMDLSEGFKHVRKWTAHVDLFSKDFLFVPIVEHLHWSLAVICYPKLLVQLPSDSFEGVRTRAGKKSNQSDSSSVDSSLDSSGKPIKPCVLMLDSLKLPKTAVVRLLRKYLEMEYADKFSKTAVTSPNGSSVDVDTIEDLELLHESNQQKASALNAFNRLFQVSGKDESSAESIPIKVLPSKLKINESTLPLYRPDIPQQDNHCDCGVYMLHYIELFLNKPPTAASLPKAVDRPYWFDAEDISKKRLLIGEIICGLSGNNPTVAAVLAELEMNRLPKRKRDSKPIEKKPDVKASMSTARKILTPTSETPKESQSTPSSSPEPARKRLKRLKRMKKKGEKNNDSSSDSGNDSVFESVFESSPSKKSMARALAKLRYPLSDSDDIVGQRVVI